MSFGFNDTISLYDHQTTGARLQHNADGSFVIRDDQARADELLGTDVGRVHILKANFVWDLPDISKDGKTADFGRGDISVPLEDPARKAEAE